MAGEEAGAAVLQVLVQNLIDLSKDEISLIQGLKKEAQKLTGNLDVIKKFLNDAETRAIPNDAVKSWLKELENVAFDADNVLDELNYHRLSKEIMAKKSRNEKAIRCFSSFIHIVDKRNVAARIKEINMDLESSNKKATELGLKRKLADAPTVPYVGMETDAITVDPIFIGRDDVVSEIVEKLTTSIATDDDDERVLKILPIVGMGGLGKTTLTRRVFNHQKIETQFGSRIWVHVSQTFDPNIMFKKILEELSSKSYPGESRQEILKKLQQALKDRTYLFVFDDVWNEDNQKWEDFMNALSGVTSTKGNGIIVTTRKTEVASIVRPFHTHQLKGLSEEDCWSIIKEKTFGKKDVPSEFETIGRKIARRCQGLPLAANVVGGVLYNKSEDKWHSIEQNWLSDGEGDNISKILRLSFDNLSSPSLKKCFAYCSVIPKGGRILKEELIELWMAEGFLQPDGSNDMESVGDKFYNVLLHSSLLQVAKGKKYDDENAEWCAMHDLVHDLASSILGFHNNADGTSSRVRYMNVSVKHMQYKSSPIPKEVAKYLRTLFFEGDFSINFSSFKCLHALTLTIRNYAVTELPNSVRKLMHLRNLNISNTRIIYLPEWIGELHHLQTLKAECLRKQLPSTLKYLINLRHLYIPLHLELPAEIGRLTSLQTLQKFTVGDTNGYKIEELGSLDNLKGKLMIRNLKNVRDKEESEKANLVKKSKLFELGLSWDADGEAPEENDKAVLEGLQPSSNLKKLWIWGFRGKTFPLWTMKMAVRNVPHGSWLGLHKLTEIRLDACNECEEIPMLGHLLYLKSLSLVGFKNLHSIKSSFYGIEMLESKGASVAFTALERLELKGMTNLTKWAEVEEFGSTSEEMKVFPRLQYLDISECERLMNAPTHFSSCFTTLCFDGVGSSNMPLICMRKSTSLTKLSIQKIDGLECLPDQLFDNNQNLSELKISKCPKLREFPHGLQTLNHLEELIIEDCPNLKWIGNPSGEGQSQSSLASLRHLEIRECGELMDLPFEIVELEKLSLAGLRSLENLPRAIKSLTNANRLSILKIVQTPELMANSCVEIIILPSYTILEMSICMEWLRDCGVAIKVIVDGMFQEYGFQDFFLRLRGMEIWGCLKESIQHLPHLFKLALEKLEEEELPEWIGNLSSLEVLSLSNCTKLRRLPSLDTMQRLTKLRDLEIEDCPELRDSKCLEISHLNITVDGCLLVRSSPKKCCF